MIKPTIGRRVWFWPGKYSFGHFMNGQTDAHPLGQPCDAGIAFIQENGDINISYADHEGRMQSALNVPLWQGEGERPSSFFCEWMPYQKATAAKETALG